MWPLLTLTVILPHTNDNSETVSLPNIFTSLNPCSPATDLSTMNFPVPWSGQAQKINDVSQKPLSTQSLLELMGSNPEIPESLHVQTGVCMRKFLLANERKSVYNACTRPVAPSVASAGVVCTVWSQRRVAVVSVQRDINPEATQEIAVRRKCCKLWCLFFLTGTILGLRVWSQLLRTSPHKCGFVILTTAMSFWSPAAFLFLVGGERSWPDAGDKYG